MSEIVYKKNKLMYNRNNIDKILIDCLYRIENKSKIPVMADKNMTDSIKVIQSIMGKHMELMAGTTEDNAMDFMLIDFLSTRVLMKTAAPIRAVQLGSMNGILSFHLASLIGRYNEKSSLCCVCNGIGNESGNQWLDIISATEVTPKLSMLAADYDDTQLQPDYYDLAVINGAEFIEHPYEVIKEAERLVKEDGAIICYTIHEQPAVADCFRLIFDEYEDFEGEQFVIFWTTDMKNSWSGYSGKLDVQNIDNYIDEVQNQLQKHAEKEQLRQNILKLDEYIAQAIEEEKIDFKLRLIQTKEEVLAEMYMNGN